METTADILMRQAAKVAEQVSGYRCVVIVDRELPRWLIVNTAAVLGVAIGGRGCVPLGPDVPDRSNSLHPGIGALPLPVLTAPAEDLSTMREKALGMGLAVVDFNSAAHASQTYPDYVKRLTDTEPSYLGLAIHGKARLVTSLTSNLRSLS